MKSFVLSVILVAMFNGADAQIGIPQIISLLDSVNDTTNTMASMLPHMENSLRNLEANQNQTTMILSQLADSQIQITSTQAQMASTQAQMASTQAEMANTLNQMILILQGKIFSEM